MKKYFIFGAAALLSAVLASALIYFTATDAEAAYADSKEIVFVNRVIETEKIVYVDRVIIVPESKPKSVFADASEEDRYCLAKNMYFESRGESQVGQEFVAWVTLNRVMDPNFPNDICSVVWQDRQFSWTHDGKSDTPTDPAAWAQAQAIAEETLLAYGVDRDPTEGATYFHADWVTPGWAKRFERVVQIDGHIFYADRG